MEDLKKILRTHQRYIDILNAENIFNVKDFLQHFPRTYENRVDLFTLNEIQIPVKQAISVKGHIISKKMFPRGGKKIYDIKFEDELGNVGQISIYNASFLASKMQLNKRYIIVGKPTFKYGRFIFSHPEVIETISGISMNEQENFAKEDKKEIDDIFHPKYYRAGRIYPIYSELSGIKPSRFAQKIWKVLPLIEQYFKEYLPKDFLEKFKLLDVVSTIKNIHYPKNMKLQKQALRRVFFDRLLRIQLYSIINKRKYQSGNISIFSDKPDRSIVQDLTNLLPFELTKSQKKVTKTMIEDIYSGKTMLRLLQGDVGSGKTIVAAIVTYYIHKKFGGQSVFAAPLEVLANQHFKTLAKLFLPLGINIQLLTGSSDPSTKRKIKNNLTEGKVHILVGTHAVLQSDVKFKNLQLAIIDEQHKFGVKQRAFFHKAGNPHILQMTATPIPRSMALAFFGEFDVSIIDELPKGRKEIYTKIISEKEYIKLKPRILTRTQQGQKVFIVTPLIEESEKMDELKSAITEFEEIKKLFPEIKNKIALLHGRMKAQEKEKIMNDFKGEKYNILVSTTVIEVGVDVSNATVMIIKNAERFGLSQLHQLRGRIGRNNMQAYCFLETHKKKSLSYERLKHMEEINDGFKLAELDLKNRGSGQILGTQQSGETDIPIEILTDIKFLEEVKEGAKQLLDKYPNLEGLGNLKKHIHDKVKGVLA